MSNNCPTRLLSDQPSPRDLFGSHERVAKAIAELIFTEKGGKCVGLQGSWGSGKSTVINSLKCELSAPANKVLVIDAWAHEGDPLRRTVLERLIDGLREWMTADQIVEWDKRSEELACRIHEKTTRTYPILKPWARNALYCSVFLFPLGLVFLTAGLRESVTIWRPGLRFAWEFMLGLLMVGSPLIPILRRAWEAKRNPKLVYTKDDVASFWSVFALKHSTEEHSTTVETPDPTSVDFARVYDDLMSCALADPDRRIVIVLDNLDRVASSDANSILSTLQVFVQSQEHDARRWYDRLWIVIPYDHTGIARLWEDKDAAKSFLDKTFQIRFEVPPPALKDWRDFLLDKLAEAMPQHNAEEFPGVVRFYNCLRANVESTPTPRAIVNFVNQIGAIHRQWHDDIPLVHMAAYVLLRERIESVRDFISRLIDDTLLERDHEARAMVGDRVNVSLAILALNLEASRAMQIILQEPISSALDKPDCRELARLAKAFDGFWAVLDSMGLVQWIGKDGLRLANATYCLVESGLLGTESPPSEALTAVSNLRRSFDDMESLGRIDPEIMDRIASLLAVIRDHKLAEDMVEKVSATPMWTNNADASLTSTWMAGLAVMIQRLNEYDFGDVYEQGITIPNGVEGYVLACSAVSAASLDPAIKLIPSTQASEIIDYLADPERLKQSQAETIATVRAMKAAEIGVDWSKLVDTIQELLRDPRLDKTEQAYTLLQVLFEVKDVYKPVGQVLGTLASDGVMMHWYSRAYDDENYERMSLFLYVHLLKHTDAGPPTTHFGLSQQGYQRITQLFGQPSPDMVSAFLDILTKYLHRRFIFALFSNAMRARPFVDSCLKLATRTAKGRVAFEPTSLVQHWRDLEEILGGRQLRELIRNRMAESDLLRYICTTKYSHQQTGLYLHMADAGASSNSDFVNWCLVGLRALPSADWWPDLKVGGPTTGLVIALSSADIALDLGDEFRAALETHAKAVVDSYHNVEHSADVWERLPQSLDLSNRHTLAVDLCRLAVETRGNRISAGYFRLYGAAMLDEKALLGTQDLMTELFIPIVSFKGSKSASKKWLIQALETLPNLTAKYKPKDDVKDFTKAVEKAARGPLLGLGKPDPLIARIHDLLSDKKK